MCIYIYIYTDKSNNIENIDKSTRTVATYRKKKQIAANNPRETIDKETHEQLDYILTGHRWRNSVRNVESDSRANIHTDHFPVIADIVLKLKKQYSHGKTRHRYKKCDEEQRTRLNDIVQQQTTTDLNNTQDKSWLEKATEELPRETPKDRFKKHHLSERSTQIIEDRGRARKDRNLAEFERLSTDFRKSRKQDRRDRILEGLTKDLDLRDRWLGIRELKTKFNPTPYHNTGQDGKHVK